MTENGLSDGDRDRIADYLEKPAHERTVDDLVPPDHDGASDRADTIDTDETGDDAN